MKEAPMKTSEKTDIKSRWNALVKNDQNLRGYQLRLDCFKSECVTKTKFVAQNAALLVHIWSFAMSYGSISRLPLALHQGRHLRLYLGNEFTLRDLLLGVLGKPVSYCWSDGNAFKLDQADGSLSGA